MSDSSKTTQKSGLWTQIGSWILGAEADAYAEQDDVVARVQSAYGTRWRMDRVTVSDLRHCVRILDAEAKVD